MKNVYRIISFYIVFTLLGCVSGTPSGVASKSPTPTVEISPTPTPTVGSENYDTSFISQPTHAVANETLSTEADIEFEEYTSAQDVVSQIESVKAYTDSTCQTEASGVFSYALSGTENIAQIQNIRYSLPEDIYIGADGPNMSKTCSGVIFVMSAHAAYFEPVMHYVPNERVGTAGETLANSIMFLIKDVNDNPVRNARIRMGNQVSSASGIDGVASLSYTLGTLAGEFSQFEDSNPHKAILEFNGNPIHELPQDLSIYANLATGLIENADEVSSPGSGGDSNPLSLYATDEYSNAVHPNLWNFTGVSAFTDSSCQNAASSQSLSYQSMENPGLDSGDQDTWFKFIGFSYSQTGTYYVRFSISSNDVFYERSGNYSKCVGPFTLN